MKTKFLLLTITLIYLMGSLSAAHYIVGFANDAKDGTPANNFIVTLWNPLNGLTNNLTDIIGQNGNSGTNNIYMIDCELLGNGCDIGDNLSVKIFNNGSDYLSEARNVTITGAGFDIAQNISLNTPPTTSPVYPINYQNISNPSIIFNCSVNDLDGNLANVTLYGNWSGGWHPNETKTIIGSNNFSLFTKTLPQGTYQYGCKVTDNLSISRFSENNNTFTIDLTKPVISSIIINESYVCGNSQIRVNCTATDQILGVNKVVIQAIAPSYIKNYTGIFLTGDTYYSDILINETGLWKFNCIVKDSAGNENNLTSNGFNGFSSNPELYVNYQTIFLSNNDPFENESIFINASIENLGCGDANGVLIGFFIGDPDSGGININNNTISITGLSSLESKISWNAQIGRNNIFVFADSNNSFSEENETNNKANNTFSINAWQDIYGNISINKIIGGLSSNLTHWLNESTFTGNVFITDSECNVNWLTLQSISKTKTGGSSSNDFSEIDSLLGMSDFEDSVSIIFSDNQIPKNTENFLIHQNSISEVPVINSTENSDFITGILWDYSDDSLDGEYDVSDEEDLVFVAKVKQGFEGEYGRYDYEIKIPARLREYKNIDSAEIYFYYDLN
jgi:hypothetical protein